MSEFRRNAVSEVTPASRLPNGSATVQASLRNAMFIQSLARGLKSQLPSKHRYAMEGV
jgi:hypothetical protein